jgi:glycosyltransferase involved in cell wall biosynthesis
VLKVLHVGKFYPPVPGGIERVVHSLCTITQHRLDNRVLAFNTGPSTVDDVVDGVSVTRVGTWGSAGSVSIAPGYFAHLKRARADVMILHEPNPWALLAFAAVRPRLPLAIWFHSEVVRPRLQYELFYAPVARPAYRAARRFLVSSPALAEQAASLQPYRDKVRVIPFGIDVERWKPCARVRARAEEIRREAGRPIVLFAGRHVPYKGLEVLLQAAAPLDVHVAILGDGPMRAAWTAAAAAVQGRATFVFHGEVADDEMRAQLAASRMLVLPSVSRAETFGFVQLEAMACGVPVISTALPTGVPWVNQTGVIVPPGDVDALRAGIARLAADGDLATRIGAAGEARARTEFSLDVMGNRLVDVCMELAGEARSVGDESRASRDRGSVQGGRGDEVRPVER